MSNEKDTTPGTRVIEEFDAGLFARKLTAVMQQAALSVIDYGATDKKGKVTIDMTITRVGDSRQISVAHRLAYSKPTLRGKAGEDETTSTVFYVHQNGKLSMSPEKQTELFPDKVKAFSQED